jgi:hypothetical protein
MNAMALKIAAIPQKIHNRFCNVPPYHSRPARKRPPSGKGSLRGARNSAAIEQPEEKVRGTYQASEERASQGGSTLPGGSDHQDDAKQEGNGDAEQIHKGHDPEEKKQSDSCGAA